MRISEFCQRGEHSRCPIQQRQDFDFPNCQCDCHPGTIPSTFTEGQMVNKKV
jgi:hypothetical protein